MARPSARRLMHHAVDSDNMQLAGLLILAGGLEFLHELQAHQPATIPERVRSLRDFARNAIEPPTPRPAPVRA